MLLESTRDSTIRECPSESFESRNDLLSMVCGWDVFVEEGSAIDTSLIQHSLLDLVRIHNQLLISLLNGKSFVHLFMGYNSAMKKSLLVCKKITHSQNQFLA